jgi:hypothetical protein
MQTEVVQTECAASDTRLHEHREQQRGLHWMQGFILKRFPLPNTPEIKTTVTRVGDLARRSGGPESFTDYSVLEHLMYPQNY